MMSIIMDDATLHLGDCFEEMACMADNSVDSIVCDPPYELGFMGKVWDNTGIANSVSMWREALRVLKPGGHLLAFSGSRTYHRMTCAIEDAGFEVRDQIMWIYGSGFPKSLDVSKAIDRAAGAEREVVGQRDRRSAHDGAARISTSGDAEPQCGGRSASVDITSPKTESAVCWDGFGTALKPAHEPICVARKPLIGTVVDNILHHGTGAININACRVPTDEVLRDGSGGLLSHQRDGKQYPNTRAGEASAETRYTEAGGTDFVMKPGPRGGDPMGRWPANIIHDGSDEVLAAFAEFGEKKAGGSRTGNEPSEKTKNAYGVYGKTSWDSHADTGTAARFFYCAKTSRSDRNDGCDALPQKIGGMVSNTSGQHITRRDDEYEARPSGNFHPTVKPVDLMAYLCRLVTPPGGTVLDPFMGSGSTGKAAIREGFKFIGIDMMPEYIEIARARIKHEITEVNRAKAQGQLFGEVEE